MGVSMLSEQPKFPNIKITGIDKYEEISVGVKVSIDGVAIPTVSRATITFDRDEFATVTLTMAGKVDLDELEAIPMVHIVDERKEK